MKRIYRRRAKEKVGQLEKKPFDKKNFEIDFIRAKFYCVWIYHFLFVLLFPFDWFDVQIKENHWSCILVLVCINLKEWQVIPTDWKMDILKKMFGINGAEATEKDAPITDKNGKGWVFMIVEMWWILVPGYEYMSFVVWVDGL